MPESIFDFNLFSDISHCGSERDCLPSSQKYNHIKLTMSQAQVHCIDSHTEGEPTRVVVSGIPDLGSGTVREQAEILNRDHFSFLTSVVCEPHGHEAMVGALLVPPSDPSAHAGVIFFDPAQVIGMCGHGTIGLVKTLGFMQESGRAWPGKPLPEVGQPIRIETRVGMVSAQVEPSGEATVENVPSHRHQAGVKVDVQAYGEIHGDISYGGNWFFLVKNCPIEISMDHLDELTLFTKAVRKALADQGITGEGGTEIDHVEVFGPPQLPGANSKNFVMCPGGAFDRSPCGTGTSAKLACLAADGVLKPGDSWVQESILGTRFLATYQKVENGNKIIPHITGRAFITAQLQLEFDPKDPVVNGFRTAADC